MLNPQMDEYWIARIQYWPEEEPEVEVIYIGYVWQDGAIDFIPCTRGGRLVCSTQCEEFEILERIALERYR